MTTLYKPVLIESAEQAEALSIGTVATRGAIAAVRVPEQTHDKPWRSGVLGWAHVSAIGWTALVPIEAEEETVERRKLCQKTPDVLRRYVTGWQHYTAEEQNR